jgi:hypothetical protein
MVVVNASLGPRNALVCCATEFAEPSQEAFGKQRIQPLSLLQGFNPNVRLLAQIDQPAHVQLRLFPKRSVKIAAAFLKALIAFSADFGAKRGNELLIAKLKKLQKFVQMKCLGGH